jgi:hypothetical protein
VSWVFIGPEERAAIERAFQDDVASIKDEEQRAAGVNERWRVFRLALEAIERA